MPSEKTHRTSERKRLRNRSIRSETRTLITEAREAIGSGSFEEAEEAVKKAVVAQDKAVSKGLTHPNSAARRKSRLTKKLNTLKAEETES